MGHIGPTDPPEYNWLYSIPAAVFTGGFLLAAQTGFAGLVQAGYLVSSILCISRPCFLRLGLPHPHTTSTRLAQRIGIPIYCKTRKRPRNAGRWLWFPYVLSCSRVPTSCPRAIWYVGCCRGDGRFDHWKKDHCHGASSDGGWSVVFIIKFTRTTNLSPNTLAQPCIPSSVSLLSLLLLEACWRILATRLCFMYGTRASPFISYQFIPGFHSSLPHISASSSAESHSPDPSSPS
jgi:hypothetical protein